MRLSIRHKLFLTLLLATGLVAVGMLLFMSWSFEHGFVRFAEARQQERIEAIVRELGEIYGADGGWDRLRNDRRRWVEVLLESRERRRRHAPPWGRDVHPGHGNLWPPPPPRSHDRQRTPRFLALRVMLLDARHGIIFGRSEGRDALALHPIEQAGKTVGYLGVLPGPALAQLGEIRFLERQTHAFVLIAIAMVVLAAALALLLANRLVRPLRAFTDGARALAAGRFDTRIAVRSRDELGQLARDFNGLAEALARNEQMRRQWVADISHELRTPLAVIRGELEALQDGVRPLTPAAVSSLHADVMRLGRLIDDLYELSMSDLGALDYHKTSVDPVALLRDDIDSLRRSFDDKDITVTVTDRLSQPVPVQADPDRLSQLFRNLLGNSAHYTDPGGQVAISVARSGDRLAIQFEDTAPGVAAEDLPRLFERLYRVEPSRSRAHGGAGLGLAICRNIVDAHGGEISAQPSPLGGLLVRILLPL